MRGNEAKSKTGKRSVGRRQDTFLFQWTVVHCAAENPRVVYRDMVTAADLKSARIIAERRFADSEIIRIIQQEKDDADRYPGARFIRGQFRPVTASDEAVLHDICD